MFKENHFRKKLVLTFIIFVLAGSISAQPPVPYESWGVLVEGANCVLFAPQGDPYFRFALDNYGGFGIGDEVFVSGFKDLNCGTNCLDAAGCILDNTISGSQHVPDNFEGWGVLDRSSNCLLFAPFGDCKKYVLDDYGLFDDGDEVFISGQLDFDDQTGCVTANGYIFDNLIDSSGRYHKSFDAWGVLIESTNCILFAPWNNPFEQYILDNYGEFYVGDTVFVSGSLDLECEKSCQDARGCIVNNTIESESGVNDLLPYQIIVGIEPGAHIELLIEDFHGELIDSILNVYTYLISFPDSMMMVSVIDMLSGSPEVLFVEPNYDFDLPEVNQVSQGFPDEVNDVYLKGISPASFYEQPGSYMTGIDSALLLADGAGVIVAVIDNGLDMEHPLFEDALVGSGYDYVDSDYDASEVEGSLYGHGTFVSGVVLLSAPASRILPMRAFDENGKGSSFDVAKAVYEAIDNGVDIINMSFGMYTSNLILEEAIDSAYRAGIIMVSSVGNDGCVNPMYPASLNNVIAVSAIDTLEYLANFSNYGDHVDICAPGVNIYSAFPGEYEWGTWSGTSFAAPFVTGVCALLKSTVDTITFDGARETLINTARQELSWGTVIPPDIYYGYGCINGYEAVLSWCNGDVDNSRSINISDVTYLISYLFGHGPSPKFSKRMGDFNCDHKTNITDVNWMLNYLFDHAEPVRPCY